MHRQIRQAQIGRAASRLRLQVADALILSTSSGNTCTCTLVLVRAAPASTTTSENSRLKRWPAHWQPLCRTSLSRIATVSQSLPLASNLHLHSKLLSPHGRGATRHDA